MADDTDQNEPSHEEAAQTAARAKFLEKLVETAEAVERSVGYAQERYDKAAEEEQEAYVDLLRLKSEHEVIVKAHNDLDRAYVSERAKLTLFGEATS